MIHSLYSGKNLGKKQKSTGSLSRADLFLL